jgi:hypothetical protein
MSMPRSAGYAPRRQGRLGVCSQHDPSVWAWWQTMSMTKGERNMRGQCIRCGRFTKRETHHYYDGTPYVSDTYELACDQHLPDLDMGD